MLHGLSKLGQGFLMTWRHIPKDLNPQHDHCEKLMFHRFMYSVLYDAIRDSVSNGRMIHNWRDGAWPNLL